MAGGSDEHNRIAGRLAQLLGSRETGSCGYYPSDQRFWIASRARGRYSADRSSAVRPSIRSTTIKPQPTRPW
jgi:hypothetical protein